MPYRVELASTGRAVCKETQCKKDGIKIDKGDLRFGTLVTINDHTSWTWKHWGCTTPAQIAHLQEASGDDTDLVDGFDELPAEMQEKVKTALEEGHVADDDWRGDVEFNRPGKKGMRKRATKKATKAADEDEGEEQEASAEEKPAPKKRGRPSKAVEEVAAAPAKKRGRPAKINDEADAPAPKKAKGGKKAAAKEDEEDEEAKQEDSPPPKKPGRAKKAAAKEEDEDEEVKEAEVEAPKPKRGRPKGTATKPVTEKALPQKRGRPKKVIA